MSDTPLVDAVDVSKRYPLPRSSLFVGPGGVDALRNVDFTIERARSLGVVGESGCGKSTLARLVMALEAPSEGEIRVLNRNLNELPADELRRMRRHFQMVFQDPFGALDPRHKVARIVAEPLQALQADLDRRQRREQALEVMASVGLRPGDADKYPHEFSGGQRQRIAIARALVTRPELIVADEPVSALDVSVQAQVLNLMQDLRESHGVTYMLISHDLAVVEYICDDVMVMYLGQIVEKAPAAALFEAPSHPYTRLLLESVPRIDAGRRRRDEKRVTAEQADVQEVSASGCAFAPRCPIAESRCFSETPALRELKTGHLSRCHLA
jgi:peptide/nickel transport system ATP-binding protein